MTDGIIQLTVKDMFESYNLHPKGQIGSMILELQQELIAKIKEELNKSEYYFGDSHGKIIKKLIGDNK